MVYNSRNRVCCVLCWWLRPTVTWVFFWPPLGTRPTVPESLLRQEALLAAESLLGLVLESLLVEPVVMYLLQGESLLLEAVVGGEEREGGD